jgi:acylphosphatase
MADERIAARFYVSGVVQGVGYRYFARGVAMRLGLTGFVRNLRDGRVEVLAIGTQETMAELKAQLQLGPSGASVTNVIEEAARIDEQRAGTFAIEIDN